MIPPDLGVSRTTLAYLEREQRAGDNVSPPPSGPVRRPTAEQLLVAGIVVASGLCSAWNLGYAGYSTFYSTAAHSMTVSWRALAFGGFDPGASVTLDK